MHLHLNNFAIVFATIQVIGNINVRFLNQELVSALFAKTTASIRNYRIAELDQTVTHTASEIVHFDQSISEVCIGLFKQDRLGDAERALLCNCIATA